MVKFKKTLACIIKKISRRMAIMACGTASYYGGYQMKEPNNIMKNKEL